MYRLVTLLAMLCLTFVSLCPNSELSEHYKKELPKNVVDPLFASLTLSELEPPSASVTLSEYYKKEIPKNVVDPLFASISFSLLEPLSASVSYSMLESPSTLQPEDLPLSKYYKKELPKNVVESLDTLQPKDLSLCKNESKKLPLQDGLVVAVIGGEDKTVPPDKCEEDGLVEADVCNED